MSASTIVVEGIIREEIAEAYPHAARSTGVLKRDLLALMLLLALVASAWQRG